MPQFTTLIDAPTLADHLDDPDWIVFDCRFSLADPERGHRDYLAGHIRGAQYLDLNRDLSARVVPGKTGRHPLPSVEEAARLFGGRGVGPNAQVIAYDDRAGSIAARLWWMLKWLGHDAVAVLDGGWSSWVARRGPTATGDERRAPAPFQARPRPDFEVTVDEIRQRGGRSDFVLFDARASERYRGEAEPIDPVAGHIPGARSLPFQKNLGPEGRFLPPAELKRRFEAALGDSSASEAVVYCGSGVTAAHDLLAFEVAGLERPRLYAGSWSEWITDPDRPVALGDEDRSQA